MKTLNQPAILIALCATLTQASALPWDANGTTTVNFTTVTGASTAKLFVDVQAIQN